MTAPSAPLGLLAELTHRCPLACPYCSNPLELAQARDELDSATWQRVLSEAADLGVLQVHLSGGEPAARRDLVALVAHAAKRGLYTNLITAGVSIDERRWSELAGAGLDHVQVSFQDADIAGCDRIAGMPGAFARKQAFAARVRASGVPLTVNAVVHRHNLQRVESLIELAAALGATRIEVAHVQYYGWALRNRAALLPTRSQLDVATETVERARARYAGVLAIDYVAPDYYAERPKACMGGWGRRFIMVTPTGAILPCHAAQTLPGLDFPSVHGSGLTEAWFRSSAFERFRGTGWMAEPCRSCDQREIDWGGCRCQALALAGDAAAADPACALSPHRAALERALQEAAEPSPAFAYRSAPRPVPSGRNLPAARP
jgi:pyrroloquinoline quinone biosynthesis protein E